MHRIFLLRFWQLRRYCDDNWWSQTIRMVYVLISVLAPVTSTGVNSQGMRDRSALSLMPYEPQSQFVSPGETFNETRPQKRACATVWGYHQVAVKH